MNPFVYWISIFYHWYAEKPRRKKDAYESAIAIVIMFFWDYPIFLGLIRKQVLTIPKTQFLHPTHRFVISIMVGR